MKDYTEQISTDLAALEAVEPIRLIKDKDYEVIRPLPIMATDKYNASYNDEQKKALADSVEFGHGYAFFKVGTVITFESNTLECYRFFRNGTDVDVLFEPTGMPQDFIKPALSFNLSNKPATEAVDKEDKDTMQTMLSTASDHDICNALEYVFKDKLIYCLTDTFKESDAKAIADRLIGLAVTACCVTSSGKQRFLELFPYVTNVDDLAEALDTEVPKQALCPEELEPDVEYYSSLPLLVSENAKDTVSGDLYEIFKARGWIEGTDAVIPAYTTFVFLSLDNDICRIRIENKELELFVVKDSYSFYPAK